MTKSSFGTFPQVVTALAGIIYLVLGITFVIDPSFLAQVMSMPSLGPTGLAEILTFYGGFELGIGIFLLLGAFRAEHLRSALIFQIWGLLSCAAARLFAMARYTGEDSIIFYLFLSELLMGLLALRALVIHDRGNPDRRRTV